ncbi:MAG: methyltransferase domain-containing protein [Alphaproteobacteria bacterium]
MSDLEKAINYYQKKDYKKAIKLASEIKSKKAYFILAESYFALKEYQKTIPYYECLLQNNIKDAWLANHLSQSYEEVGNYPKAIEAGFKSLELAPENNKHHLNFAYLLYDIKDEGAIKKWQKLYPNNSIASHFSASLLGDCNKKDSNLDYIKEIFDNFSSSFDEVLDSLSYKAPEYIAQICKEINLKKARILDLGCGTGLCGKLLKKHACKKGLYGVDISSNMLDSAQSKNVYSHLINDDIFSYLDTSKDVFDCVVASDVFTYFGDLSKVVKLSAKNIKNDGYFVFTVSKNSVNSSDVFLHQSGRFLHSENYIKKELKKQGFFCLKTEEKVLRFEGDSPVIGFVFLAKKRP